MTRAEQVEGFDEEYMELDEPSAMHDEDDYSDMEENVGLLM